MTVHLSVACLVDWSDDMHVPFDCLRVVVAHTVRLLRSTVGILLIFYQTHVRETAHRTEGVKAESEVGSRD